MTHKAKYTYTLSPKSEFLSSQEVKSRTPFGAVATPKSLLHLKEMIPEGSIWSVTGIGRAHLPMSMMGITMGGRGICVESNMLKY